MIPFTYADESLRSCAPTNQSLHTGTFTNGALHIGMNSEVSLIISANYNKLFHANTHSKGYLWLIIFMKISLWHNVWPIGAFLKYATTVDPPNKAQFYRLVIAKFYCILLLYCT